MKTDNHLPHDRYNKDIQMLNDTLEYCGKSDFVNGYKRADVYLPDDIDRICNAENNVKRVISLGSRCGYSVNNADSFTAARMLAKESCLFNADSKKEVLVLNFANPVNPGGGVRHGSKAQEEDLCRKSSLLLSLESDEAKRYYDYNKSLGTYLGSDAVIISPNVDIIRDENGKMLEKSVRVAVMTCAAPMINYGLEGLTQQQYEELFYNRILKILKLAAHLRYGVLVLGAWGCGAFHNDAALVSDLFYKALKSFKYNGMSENLLFRRIEFAVLSRGSAQYNYEQFLRNFGDFYREEDAAQTERALQRIKETEVNLDKIRGCMIGGAAGDALGYTVEFLNEEQIFSRYGKNGITKFELDGASGKALISDDTQMTLFTANGLLLGSTRGAMRGIMGNPRHYVADMYGDWLLTQNISFAEKKNYPSRKSWLTEIPELYSRRAPGNTCLTALKNRKSGYTESYLKVRLNNSKGCGGVMRVAPVGLMPYSSSIDIVDTEAAEIAAITHSHPLGYMPAALLAHIIHRAVYSRGDSTLKEIVLEALNTVCLIFKDNEYINDLKKIIMKAVELSENRSSDLDNIHVLGEGWVAEETLAIAVYCALRYKNDFSKGIIVSVNHNGDSDSTGAVTGNILGAWLGFEKIEDKWKNDLELYELILETADDLCHDCQMSEYSHYTDKKWVFKYMSDH